MKVEVIRTGSYATNSYIISNSKGECVIVDPGLNYNNAAKIIKEKYKPIAILLTHAHMDHIDGITYFLDLPIYLYKDEVKVFNDDNINLYETLGRTTLYSISDFDCRLVNDLDMIIISDFKFKVIHTPGHTICSCCYLIDDDLFCGDTLFNLSCGRWDFPTGDANAMQKSLNRLFQMLSDDIKCYPGHNNITTIGYERLYNPFLKNEYNFIK